MLYPSYVSSSMRFCLFPKFFICCLACFISLVSKEVAFPVNLKKNLFLHPIVSPILICAEVFVVLINPIVISIKKIIFLIVVQ